jgi:hypothetical protein
MVDISCRCGTVRGGVSEASSRTVNRVICYCDDCQAFAHYLGRPELLDPHGGSDIVQLAPASLSIHDGQERIVGVRLTSKGLFRWYANCCHTPVGNTVSPAIPFVGVMTEAFETGGQLPDQLFGRPVGAIKGEYAIGEPPPGSKGIGLPLMARSIAKVLGWRLAGRSWPHPFFDQSTRKPIYPVASLSLEQREALRIFCGPKPTALPRSTN